MHSGTIVYNIVLTVSSTLRTYFADCIAERGKRGYISDTACSGTPALFLFNTEQHRPPTATVPTTMLSLSWINLPDISISGLINPGSENIVQILVATFTLLALLPRSCYFQSILCDRLKLRLTDPQVYDFPSPFYLSFRC